MIPPDHVVWLWRLMLVALLTGFNRRYLEQLFIGWFT
jgi:hypothetical protein